jgi:CubicO group peptidase (beta-lactamase class C family)
VKPAQRKIIVRPLTRYEIEDKLFRAYGAGGNGGQIVMVIPDLDLVVGINGGSYGEFTKWNRRYQRWLSGRSRN